MAVRRALVGCTVLCVQEGNVVYPFCKNCYSRMVVDFQDSERCTCSKCGYNCPKAQVGFRYRLSLRVTTKMSIFGVTVFGTCLNSFFGIHASGLQRLVESCHAANKAALLKQAVEDCFIGRHLIFGIKVKDTFCGPWSDGCSGIAGRTTPGPAHFIATDILLPTAGQGAGCSVLQYYHALLQRAITLGSPGSSKASIMPAAPLLLPLQPPGSEVLTNSPPHSLFLSRRLMNHGSVLCLDSPWQRSLGMVTSSQEQDSQMDEGDEPDNHHHHPQPNEKPAETQRRSPKGVHIVNERGLSIGESFTCSQWSPYAASSTTPLPPTSHFQSHSTGTEKESPEQCTQEIDVPACDSLVWEDDIVYSKGLEAFILCQENRPDHRNSTDFCHFQKGDGKTRTLADISNTCTPSHAPDAMQKSARQFNKVVGKREVCGGGSSLLSFDPMGGQGFCIDVPVLACDGDATDDDYNCSADLFSDHKAVVTMAKQAFSPNVVTTTNSRIILTHKDTQTLKADTNTEEGMYPQPQAWSNLDDAEGAARSDQHLEASTSALQLIFTPHKLRECSDRYEATDSNECQSLCHQTITTHGSEPIPLDFVPPLQSTPLPRISVHIGPGAAVHRTTADFTLLGCLKPDRQPQCLPHIITTTPPPPGCSSHYFSPSQLHCRTKKCMELDSVVSSKTPVRKNRKHKLTSRRRFRNMDRAKHAAQTNAVESKPLEQSAESVRQDGSVHQLLFDEKQEFDLSRDLFADSFH